MSRSLLSMILCSFLLTAAGQNPVISKLAYDSISPQSVTVSWQTDLAADSRIRWMATDSNYQPVAFTDSLYSSGLVSNHIVTIDSLSPSTIYRYQVTSATATGSATDSGYFVTQSLSGGSISVYFNHTVDTSVSTGEYANGDVNFEHLLDTQIAQADSSIDITLWEFSDITSVATALIDARNRGVRIRFIYNSTPNTPLLNTLIANGIQVIKRNYDTVGFSMHDKFWIFDYRYNTDPSKMYLWTGSTNVSHAMFHEDRNNIILIQDEALCAVYTREFEQMWGSHTDLPVPAMEKFGPLKRDLVPHVLNTGGTRIEVYLSPADSIADSIGSIIQTKTHKSLAFCMYKFSLPPVENSLHEIFQNGIQVSGVFDSSNSVDKGSAFPRMKGHAVPGAWNPPADVFIDTLPGLLHHKYFLVDADSSGNDRIVSTGSYNWEVPAETGNDENLLIIHDSRVNNLYFQEFSARYKESGGKIFGMGVDTVPGRSGILLQQNYPNPFSGITYIQFSLPVSGDVTLTVSDLTDRVVKIILREKLEPGIYTLPLDGTDWPEGIYFCTLSSSGFSVTRKMCVVR